uniref:Uncharacterized protein n=1 Tax=Human herpesvirus 2 TaxID=10310 RepID=A0A481TTJ0_HHV2|nr:hypothetical protein [Human alphaherpesvirus 2]QBH84042.1 hypothetical protein [Human alphaherpesvirus 2]
MCAAPATSGACLWAGRPDEYCCFRRPNPPPPINRLFVPLTTHPVSRVWFPGKPHPTP